MTGRGLALAAWALVTTGLWGLEGEVGVTVTRTMAAVVAGPPGTPAQEVGVDRARVEAVAGHQQPLLWGWSAQALGRVGFDTLPSDSPRTLPETKLAPSASLLEAWLGWEPLPGTLALGAGKRRLQPSSGFSHKPLDELARADDREGCTGAQAAWFGDGASASVFASPGWPEAGTNEGFVLGRAAATFGSVDLKAQGLFGGRVPRAGAGLDGSWGDHLTLRAEAAADANLATLREDILVGFTWTADDLSTLMVEAVWDARESQPQWMGFVRGSIPLGGDWESQAWVKANVPPQDWDHPAGWTGLGLTWKAPKWSMDAGWTGGWGPAGTAAGDSPFRWKTEVVAKVFL